MSERLRILRCSDPAVTSLAQVAWWLRHPLSRPRPEFPPAGFRVVLVTACRAPRLTVEVSDDPTGQTIIKYLAKVRRRYAKSVLLIPPDGEPLFSGRSLQALRTNVRRARARGLSCVELSAPGEEADPRVFGLFDGSAQKIGEAMVTVDRSWALVHGLSSTLPEGFYLLHAHMVEELQAAGVAYLIMSSRNAVLLKPGLLYMQARMGYAVFHLRVPRRVRRAGVLAEPDPVAQA